MSPHPTTDTLLAQTEWLRRLARSLVVDADRAEDITQDTLLLALRRATRPRNPRAWLGRVARSLAANRGRGDRRRRHRERQAARDEALPSAAALVERVEYQRTAADAVLRLPEPYRSAILLRFFEDLSHAELADRMGVKLETARTRLKRGLRMLRRELDREYEGPRAWATALLALPQTKPGPEPWAGPGAGAGTGTGATTASLGGILMMTGKSKILIPIALVIAALIATPFVLPEHTPEKPTHSIAADPQSVTPPIEVTPPKDQSPTREAVTPTAREAPAPNLIITGRLVDEETLGGVADATIHILAAEDRFEKPSANDDPVARSGRDGMFRCELHRKRSPMPDVLAARAGARAPLLQSFRGEPDENGVRIVHLGELHMAPGTEVHGQVVSPDGTRSIPQAELFVPTRATHFTEPEGRVADLLARLRPVGRTDSEGRFSLSERLLPGSRPTFLIAVSREGLGWISVQLRRKRHRIDRLELRLRPSSGLTIIVQDATGRPIQNVDARAEPLALPLCNHSMQTEFANRGALASLFSKTTNAGGLAQFSNLPVGLDTEGRPAGKYRIHASADGFRDGHLDLELTKDDTIHRRITLRPSAPITLTGIVADAAGKPISGAEVEVFAHEKIRTKTQADGGFQIPGFVTSRGEVSFKISAKGFASLTQRRPVPPADDGNRLEFTLARAASVHGKVIDQNGEPVSGAFVLLDGGVVIKKASAKGTFAFPGTKSGAHTLMVVPPTPRAAFRGSYTGEFSTDDSPLEIVLQRIPDHEFTKLVVDVVDGETGMALDPVRALVHPVDVGQDESIPVCELRIGEVVAEKLRPGKWKLEVEAAEGHRAERTFSIQPGQTRVKLRLAVGALGSIEGRIDLTGIPIARHPKTLTLRIRSRGAHWVEYGTDEHTRKRHARATDREYVVDLGVTDRFRLEGVDPAGPVTVTVRSDGFRGELRDEVRPGVESETILRVSTTPPKK